MKFEGRSESTIYLLAFDKRLTYLRKENDITRKYVDEKIGNFDSENHYFVQDMKSWDDCTTEEIQRVTSNRVTRYPSYYEI